MTEKPKVLSLTETADYTGINKRKLYRMIKDGSFDVDPIKGTIPRLWNSDNVDEWMKS